ncbi:hypothetical protein [Pseudoxanthomonas winnipegensis]|uniref:hypothetical protein n=1 Tax=Pseudoxanthomonas winnipegensis TaxID=2480810 RepID=UPI0010406AF3|nr:hypothetical protein [Pseudoxanthomonas winnipegensis]TBV69790.1 hypothetical protein EYC45_19270 [Pseudoxanthomonas winnipegensis]
MFGWFNRVPTDHVDEIVNLARAEQTSIARERDASRRQHRHDVDQMKHDQSRSRTAWDAYDKEHAANVVLMRRVAELEAQLRGEAPPTKPVVEILCTHLHDSKMDMRAVRDAIDVALNEHVPERKHQAFIATLGSAYRRIGEQQREDEIKLCARRERFRAEFLKMILS